MKVRHSDEAETRHRRKDANHIGMKPKLGTNTKVKVRHRNEAECRHRHIDANQA